MFKLTKSPKIITNIIIGTLLVGSFIGQSGNRKAIAVNNTNSGGDVFGIELNYFDSAFQCGSDPTQADIKVNVYDQNYQLLTTLSKGDTYTSADYNSVSDFNFTYEINNLSCIRSGSVWGARGTELLGAGDSVPNVGGFSGQQSISQMLNGLNDYEELYLAELGTSNTLSAAYDLQDVVLMVNNNPASLINPAPPQPQFTD